MRVVTLFIPVLLFCTSKAQSSFNWDDNSFNAGAKRKVHILYNLDKATFYGTENGASLDTLVIFLSRNPHLRIEVDVHTDITAYPQHNMILSQGRADAVRDTLITLGINGERIIAKGWGYTKPLYSRKYVADYCQTHKGCDGEQYPDRPINRRTEITIYATNYNLTFNWNDSVFMVGSQRSMHVLYDLDYCGPTEASKLLLDTLVGFLKKNKTLTVEYAVYTDQQGQPEHNKILSNCRAERSVGYILSKGIDSARVIPKGYGDTDLLIPTHDVAK
jgi:outer membrane protein OmpA-like peptidoglycan-associated protein